MKKFELHFSPRREDLATVDQAIQQILTRINKEVFKYTYYAAGSSGKVIITNIIKPAKRGTGCRLSFEFEPQAIPLESFLLASTGGAALVEPFLGTLMRALLSCLQLKTGDIETLDLQDFSVERVTMQIPFLAKSETEASKLLLDLAHHLKVVMDMGNPLPNRRWNLPKKNCTLVQWSGADKKCLDVTLPFGALKVYVAADSNGVSGSYPGDEDNEIRASRIISLRKLVCLEIEAVISEAVDPKDLITTLSPKLEHWFPQGMSINPYLHIWTAMAWHTWLDLDLATSEDDPRITPMTDIQQDLLRTYFAGRPIREHEAIASDHSRLVALHSAVIAKIGIDLMNPWRTFKLNLASELRQLIKYESRLNFEDAFFAEMFLTPKNAAISGHALDSDKRPGRGNLA